METKILVELDGDLQGLELAARAGVPPSPSGPLSWGQVPLGLVLAFLFGM